MRYMVMFLGVVLLTACGASPTAPVCHSRSIRLEVLRGGTAYFGGGVAHHILDDLRAEDGVSCMLWSSVAEWHEVGPSVGILLDRQTWNCSGCEDLLRQAVEAETPVPGQLPHLIDAGARE